MRTRMCRIHKLTVASVLDRSVSDRDVPYLHRALRRLGMGYGSLLYRLLVSFSPA